jgi:hypothetical protein
VPLIDAHEPWLTLIGLRLVWDRNIGPGSAAGGSGGAGGARGAGGAAAGGTVTGGAVTGGQESDVPPGAIAGTLRA